MRSRYKAIIFLTIIIILLFFSDIVRLSIQNSLSLCVQGLIPALFPYFVLSGVLLDLGIDLLFPGPWSSFLIGQICGFPLGTRSVCNLYQQNKLDRHQAHGLLMCTANASPAFVVVILGSVVLHNKELGYTLLLCQFLCSLLIFILFVPNKCKKHAHQTQTVSLIRSLMQNTKNAAEQLLFVCSLTTFFGIIFDFLYHLPFYDLPLFRMVTACTELLHGVTIFKENEIINISVILGLSGLCVWMQCAYYIRNTDLSFRYLVFGKLLYGLTLPSLMVILTSPQMKYKINALIIIILTNTIATCIIKNKGCEINHDIFKKHRKMLRLLRTRYQDCTTGTGSLPS